MAGPTNIEPSTNLFADYATTKETRDVLDKVQKIEIQHDHFRSRIMLGLGFGGATKRVTTEHELRTQLASLAAEDLQGATLSVLKTAGRQLSTFHRDRRSGMKKLFYQTQEFAKPFSDFLDAFSGVVSVIRGLGAPYGEAAFETLSLLLTILVNKSMNDRLFGDLIKDLAVLFPRVEKLMSVYPSSELQKFAATAYVEVIMFARAAAEYFTRLSKRIRIAILSPVATGIVVQAGLIKSQFAEVNNEAMVLLHKRNQIIEQDVGRLRKDTTELKQSNDKLLDGNEELKRGKDELKESNEELKKELNGLKEGAFKLIRQNATLKQELHDLKRYQMMLIDQDIQDRLDRLRVSLGLQEEPSTMAETQVNGVHRVLSEIFPGACEGEDRPSLHGRYHAHRFQQMSQKKLLSHADFVKWRDAPTSLLLFMSGTTEWDGRHNVSSTCSWLSPAAVFAARHLSKMPASSRETSLHLQDVASATSKALEAPIHADPEDLCVFYSCHPRMLSDGMREHDPIRMLGVILWSLCHWSSISLMRYAEQHRSRVEHITGDKNKEPKVIMKELTALIVEIIRKTAYPSNTVWIILDRVDQCAGGFPRVMAQLVALLSCNQGPKVKILVIADSSHVGEWDKVDLERDDEDRVLFCSGYDQGRTTWYERSSDNLAANRAT